MFKLKGILPTVQIVEDEVLDTHEVMIDRERNEIHEGAEEEE